jgi:hypothetical protein
MTEERGVCFACGRPLGRNPALIDSRDGQTAFVGNGCLKNIAAAREAGYQPSRGGPRLYMLPKGLSQQHVAELHLKRRKA